MQTIAGTTDLRNMVRKVSSSGKVELQESVLPSLFSSSALHGICIEAVLKPLEEADLLSCEARPWSGLWHFNGISHGNFVDSPLWAGPLVTKTAKSACDGRSV